MYIFKSILLTIASLLLVIYAALVGYAYWPYEDGLPAKQYADKDDRFVNVNGIELRYRTWGEQAEGRPAIVLIHGFANSISTFRRLGPLLSEDYYVVALDMPGFGLSAKPDDHDYGNASQAGIVEAFIEIMELDEVIIGGHSMGGALSVHIAIDSPQVIGAVLLNPGIITTGVPSATQYFVFPLPRLGAKTFANRAFRERFIKRSFVNPDIITDEDVDELMLGSKTDDYIEGTTRLMNFYVAGNEVTMLKDIQMPVLIVWGVEDKGKPAGEAEQLAGMITNSRLVKIQNAGHYVHEEKPQKTADAINSAKNFWANRD